MTPEQRERLELAAKACGYEVDDSEMDTLLWVHTKTAGLNSDGEPADFKGWNPLEDSGDCAEMNALLDINTAWDDEHKCVEAKGETNWTVTMFEDYADHNGDKLAAWRWASVRCAAEVQRAREGGMTPAEIEEERKAFERYVLAHENLDVRRDDRGYLSEIIRRRWNSWLKNVEIAGRYPK